MSHLPVEDSSKSLVKILTLEEFLQQRTWIREKKARQSLLNAKPEFRVSKDGVRHPQVGFISRALIIQWLAEMG